MIEELVRAAVGAEAFGDVACSTQFAAEGAAVAGAVAGRRSEFATVRHCARRALRQLGVPAVPRSCRMRMGRRCGRPEWSAA